MTRTLTESDMLAMQARGREQIEAANVWSEAAREQSALVRHERMMEAQHDSVAKKWKLKSGEDLPAHSPKNIPPAWKNVKVNPDPNGKVQASGEDAKGRTQTMYHKDFTAQQAAEKFSRNQELISKADKIKAQNEGNLSHENPTVRENAAVMKLIHHTGIRPGSETDTGGEKQAYGATTLQGRHVVQDKEGNVSLQFVGKKGVDLNIPVEDKGVAKMLLERKAAAGDTGKLFKTSDSSLRDYTHTLDGGSFKPKDFRTLKGTQTALDEIKKNPAPASSMKEFKQRVRDIAKAVSQKLGNTPTIALQSYINPFVFKSIQPRA